jgi:hypothetical protein
MQWVKNTWGILFRRFNSRMRKIKDICISDDRDVSTGVVGGQRFIKDLGE